MILFLFLNGKIDVSTVAVLSGWAWPEAGWGDMMGGRP